MTGADFKRWRLVHFTSQREAAEALGIGRGTVIAYERDRRTVPRGIRLAMAAIAMGVPPYMPSR